MNAFYRIVLAKDTATVVTEHYEKIQKCFGCILISFIGIFALCSVLHSLSAISGIGN